MTATPLTTRAVPSVKLQPSSVTPSITIVVVPQEHFSYTQQSLENIYKHTKLPFELIYIDAGSPRDVQKYLAREATSKGFTLLRTDYFLAPNQARNLGLSQVTTDYVVFIDNDIHVAPGWLDNLWQCAQETDATVVCPLMCVDKPLHDHIHLAGGEARVFMDVSGNQIRRRIYEKRFLVNRSVTAVKDQLYRRGCEFTELHCVLIKRSIFDQIGPLDEKLLGFQDDMDFCLSVNRTSGRMYCEPASIVTHVSQPSYRWSDLAYLMLRWSDAWEVESLMHFQQKWDLDMDQYFMQRYRQLGYRRHHTCLYPLLRRLIGHRDSLWLEKFAVGLEQRLNQLIADRHGHLPKDNVKKFVPVAALSVSPTLTNPKRQRSTINSCSAAVRLSHQPQLVSH